MDNFVAAVGIVKAARKKARKKNVSERRYEALLETFVFCKWDEHADDEFVYR